MSSAGNGTEASPAVEATEPTAADNELQSPPSINKTSIGIALDLTPEQSQCIKDQFPTLASLTPESLGSWNEDKIQSFDRELRRLKERFDKPDVPAEIRELCPTLATFFSEAVNRGVDVMGELDMSAQKMESVMRELVYLHEHEGKPIQFRHDNSVPGRLLPLTMKKTEAGYVPDLKNN